MPRTMVFEVTLTQASSAWVSAEWHTVPGTAVAPSDFTAASGTVTFPPGVTSREILVDIRDDIDGNPEERFTVVLSNPVNAVIADDTGLGILPGDAPVVGINGPLIKNGLITNAYHNVQGRGGYFHHNSGTSEGQSVAIEASFLAWLALDGGSSPEQAAANWYKALAYQLLDAMGDGSGEGAMLRQPIPDDPDVITLLHWLFAARGDIPSQGINYDFWTTKSGGKLVIPAVVPEGALGQAHRGGPDVFRVWMIYPKTSDLLYYSPYSPTYDATTPAGDTSVPLTEDDWQVVGSTVEITIPPGAPSGITEWYVVYGYQNAGTIAQGEAQEAYPVWTPIVDGYAACAPDTFRWFDLAIALGAAHDSRFGKAAAWGKLRDAMRRTAVKGQALTDLREVFKPLPGFDAIPVGGEPSGMFCYAQHPGATPPPPEVIAAGGNEQWIGYNFWSRFADGDVKGTVPAGSGVHQVQLGRGFNDSWRQATAYQEADQALYVELSCTKKPSGGSEHFYVFLSSTKYYSGATRWYADIGAYESFVAKSDAALEDDAEVIAFIIPRTDFIRKDSDQSVLPAGTRFENFGISAEMAGAYKIRLRTLRLVSGASLSSVQSNIAVAKKGSRLPFFPGAMPFAINADTVKQQFIGWNGSPFHGYQLADHWWVLESHAEAVHPGLTVNDLPVPNQGTGAIEYPISATTAVGSVTKPKHALLAEQQLLFLKHAQDKYEADGGDRGPFAHTFVLNTPARISLGNPTPHTWVYTNDDPNTRWTGYQVRVVESLAKLVYLSVDAAAWSDARALSLAMATDWLAWLGTAWPDLDGHVVEGVTIKGMPTDYGDPAEGPPVTLYEEPHAPALILRACLWLKLADLGDVDLEALCDALMARCWTYMELRYRTDAEDTMRYTWANIDNEGEANEERESYFGFWHFEIVCTIAQCLANAAALPAAIEVATLRQRLVEGQGWLVGAVE